MKLERVPSSYRLLCLLNDVGKIFERILVQRTEAHLAKSELADSQFGFRKGRSTNDAALEVRDFMVTVCNQKEYGTAVSLDIRNAFNSISWKWILEQIELKKVPGYLKKIIRSYLSHRTLLFEGQCRGLNSGVPQGSVLCPQC